MDTKHLFRPLALATLIMLPVANAAADNRPCKAMLKALSVWNPGSTGHTYELRQSMLPKLRKQLDGIGSDRKITRGMAKKITELYYDVFVQQCLEIPDLYTHPASERARQTTKKMVNEFLDNRV